MPKHQASGAGSSWGTYLRTLWAAARRVRADARRRTGQSWCLEPLEGRVVPATISVTSLADAGVGSLRAAILEANLDPGQDTITFAPSARGTIFLDAALPALATSVDIQGPGSSDLAVARNPAPGTPRFRIFDVSAGVEVAIAGLTITGGDSGFVGWADPGDGDGRGGGGIFNAGMLSITGSTISGNSDGSTQGGGGIFNAGTLAVSGSTISGNRARGYFVASGGGIYNEGTLAIADSTIRDNLAATTMFSISSGRGGGIGGGIANAGTLTVTGSTISSNSAGAGGVLGRLARGGGIDNSGTLTLTNSTISGNAAGVYGDGGGGGGGIANAGDLTVAASTVAANTVTVGVVGGFGGGILSEGGRLTLSLSLFANPSGGNVSATGGSFASLGHNLFSDSPGVALDPTDLTDADPRLGPLADNGGPTQTMALLPGSPAIGTGVAVTGVATDQRGVARPQDGAFDIGAFEAVGVPGAVAPTVAGVRRRGVHLRPTRLVVAFDAAMDAASADDVGIYAIVPADRAGRVAPGARAIRVASATYDPATLTVTLAPRRRLDLFRSYRLTIVGTPPSGLKGASGLPLDGAGDGLPGGDFVAVLRGFKAKPIPSGRA